MHLEVWRHSSSSWPSRCSSAGKDGRLKSSFARGPALGFLLRFVLIFGLLIAPWPGWDLGYSRFFQSLGRMAFNLRGETPRKVMFQPASGEYPSLDTRIILENTELADRGEKKNCVRATEIDSRSIGWVPTALTAALVLATPIPWRRRLTALAGGFGVDQPSSFS